MADLDQRVLARAAGIRLTLEQARHRARMYLADPASDKATSAEAALAEVLGIIESAPTGALTRDEHLPRAAGDA